MFDFNTFRVRPWPLISKGHLGSKIFIPFESPYMTSFWTSMDTISLSRTVFETLDSNVYRVWPWPLTSEGYLWSNNFLPFENPCMTSYLISMDTISPSRTVFELFDFKVFRVWHWPLKVIWGQKVLNHLKAHIWLLIWLLWTPSLSHAVFEIFDFKVFRVWLWPSTSKGHLGSKRSYHSRAHIWLPFWLLWTASLYLVPFSR